MGAEHLSADIASTEEGGRMLDKEPQVFINHQKEGLKKIYSQKVPLLLFMIVVTILFATVIGLIGALVAVNAPQPSAADRCTGDWISIRGKCYYFSDKEDTWNNSRDFCLQNDSTLVTIDNEQELKMLWRYKGSENHWIGLSRKEDDSGWLWVNGTSFNENIFKIKRQSIHSNLEHAFLNHNQVRSDNNLFLNRFVCMKR